MALISGSNGVPHSDIKKVAPIKVAPTPPAVENYLTESYKPKTDKAVSLKKTK